ncbi:Hypothetical predicted protein [Olea europaea subsp. europaea]|uniref:Uncharacterized protein n=1 Tax=Olea europaea subsp. europaea TaxID=158383 RepID=A0A8S0UJA8_OLEEU|nr:Hypothetical predicted protein [Olea europaea subsp. europaea]
MEIALKSFAVVSFLLLVSLSTDMSGPLLVDARGCNWDLCEQHCSSKGLPACCPGPFGPCRCTAICPRNHIKSGPPVVDGQLCDPVLCKKYCSSQGLPWCCPGVGLWPCQCTFACPFKKEITEEVMAGATDREPFIKEIVIA